MLYFIYFARARHDMLHRVVDAVLGVIGLFLWKHFTVLALDKLIYTELEYSGTSIYQASSDETK